MRNGCDNERRTREKGLKLHYGSDLLESGRYFGSCDIRRLMSEEVWNEWQTVVYGDREQKSVVVAWKEEEMGALGEEGGFYFWMAGDSRLARVRK